MLQIVNEVNREPAHIEWRLVHVTDQTPLIDFQTVNNMTSQLSLLADHQYRENPIVCYYGHLNNVRSWIGG